MYFSFNKWPRYAPVSIRKSRATLSVTAMVACLIASNALADTTQDAIDEAKRVQQLEEARKATAQARQAIAEAEAAEAKAKLGSFDISKLTKPSGEAKGLNIEGTILAYRGLDRIASAIAVSIIPKVIPSGSEKSTPIGSR